MTASLATEASTVMLVGILQGVYSAAPVLIRRAASLSSGMGFTDASSPTGRWWPTTGSEPLVRLGPDFLDSDAGGQGIEEETAVAGGLDARIKDDHAAAVGL